MRFNKYYIVFFLLLISVFSCTDKNPLSALNDMLFDRDTNNKVENWSDVKSFVYILQNINIDELIKTKFDLVIMDYSEDGTDAKAFTSSEIYSLKNSEFGERFVISYISIGEAEDYRYYWRDEWNTNAPSWLGDENPDWEGNYKVKYWETNWQKILLGNDLSSNTPPAPDSYFGKIISAGFDGVYLDIIDAYEYWEDKGVTNAKELMIDFVALIADKCRVNNKNFGIFPQNSEELVGDNRYLNIITGLGREEVHYINFNVPRSIDEINGIKTYLDKIVEAGKLVLVTDYCDNSLYIDAAYIDSINSGYLEYCTTRELDTITINNGYQPKSN